MMTEETRESMADGEPSRPADNGAPPGLDKVALTSAAALDQMTRALGNSLMGAQGLADSLERVNRALSNTQFAEGAIKGLLDATRPNREALERMSAAFDMSAASTAFEALEPLKRESTRDALLSLPDVDFSNVRRAEDYQLDETRALRSDVAELAQIVAALSEQTGSMASVAVSAVTELERLRATLNDGQTSANRASDVMVRLTWAVVVMTLVIVVVGVLQLLHWPG